MGHLSIGCVIYDASVQIYDPTINYIKRTISCTEAILVLSSLCLMGHLSIGCVIYDASVQIYDP